MTLFTVDENLCARDGLCAEDCPAGCIVLDGNGLPAPHEKKAAYCIECGHCMAVCPTGALRLDRFDSPAEPMQARISPEQAAQFLKGRRSVRRFLNRPLTRDELAALIDLTEYAPSGHNARPVRWSVAATPEAVRSVAEATVAWMRTEVEAESETAAKLHLAGLVRAWDKGTDIICRNAPALAVPYAPLSGVTPAADGVIAAAYLELAAHGAGLGACWCGYVYLAALEDEALRKVLAIPDGHQACGALMLGRPAYRYRAVPPRSGADVTWL